MTGKSHLAYGICASAATSLLCFDKVEEMAVFTGVCLISSVLSDIDIPTSGIGKKLKLLSMGLNKMFGHRGFLHSPIFGILIAFAFYTSNNLFLLWPWLVGYFGHLVLDTLTTGGIPWLYPFSRKRFHLTKLKSGSPLEIVTLLVVIGVYIGLLVYFKETSVFFL